MVVIKITLQAAVVLSLHGRMCIRFAFRMYLNHPETAFSQCTCLNEYTICDFLNNFIDPRQYERFIYL